MKDKNGYTISPGDVVEIGDEGVLRGQVTAEHYLTSYVRRNTDRDHIPVVLEDAEGNHAHQSTAFFDESDVTRVKPPVTEPEHGPGFYYNPGRGFTYFRDLGGRWWFHGSFTGKEEREWDDVAAEIQTNAGWVWKS